MPIAEEEGDYFNSRPHEEVDDNFLQFFSLRPYFNSRPHEEVDFFFHRLYLPKKIFQLTTSRRGRHSVLVQRAFCAGAFQLTTSRRGRRQFLRKKFSFPNHFLCLLHIIYSYYINTIFFSTLFFAKSSFFLVRIP